MITVSKLFLSTISQRVIYCENSASSPPPSTVMTADSSCDCKVVIQSVG